jgi:hypothetical protein
MLAELCFGHQIDLEVAVQGVLAELSKDGLELEFD